MNAREAKRRACAWAARVLINALEAGCEDQYDSVSTDTRPGSTGADDATRIDAAINDLVAELERRGEARR